MPLSHLAGDVRRHDRDRFATVLFAPAERREALLALHAVNIEVARVRELVTEPMLGRIRLQWWRETVEQMFTEGAVPSHPAAAVLTVAARQGQLSRSPFDRLLDSRETDLEDTPPADLAALESYAEGTASTLVVLALELLGVEAEPAFRAGRHVGIAWALTGLLRAVPYHASVGRVMLPGSLLLSHGVAVEDLLRGKPPAGLAAAAGAVAERARDHLRRARLLAPEVPKAALPALLTAPLADAYLNRLERAGYDLMDTRWSVVRPRPLMLAGRMMLGRY